MKLRFYLTILCSIITLSVFAQNEQQCKSIRLFNSFRGIKLGFPIPDTLRKHLTIIPTKIDTIIYLGDWQTIDKPFLEKYLTFKEKFSDLTFNRLSDGTIYSIILSKSASENDKAEMKNKNDPPFFKSVYLELVNLFGEKTTAETITKNGATIYTIKWICENIEIDLSLANVPDISFYFSITDTKLKKLKDIESYK